MSIPLSAKNALKPQEPNKVPSRTCLGCRAKRPKAELLRLAPDLSGERPKVAFDPQGRAGGRGAWVCADSPGCLDKATKKGRLAWALRLANPDLAGLATGECLPGRAQPGASRPSHGLSGRDQSGGGQSGEGLSGRDQSGEGRQFHRNGCQRDG